jgi:hypothetical protein
VHDCWTTTEAALTWSVAIIAVPAYAFLSYGSYQLLRTRLVRRQEANAPPRSLDGNFSGWGKVKHGGGR